VGLLIEGKWSSDEARESQLRGGAFARKQSFFRDWVRADGSTLYVPEAGRYHLYVSLACPWAHRTLIFRRLKGLEEAITLSIVDPVMGENGWMFSNAAGSIPDPIFGSRFLHEVYTRAKPDYSGRVTVPVLWDRKRKTIVNNESSEIIRMFNREFDAVGEPGLDFYPEPLRAQIDEINDYVYARINDGVYRCGFATSQAAYDEAFHGLFDALDDLERRLADRRYLVGDQITEADWRLFTTLVRFDVVYVGHFKCNLRRIADYPNLSGYLRDLYQSPGVAETVNFSHIKRHYYASHVRINPSRIVALGPDFDLDLPHGREHRSRGNADATSGAAARGRPDTDEID
jgi:putative glutathione S-transferase